MYSDGIKFGEESKWMVQFFITSFINLQRPIHVMMVHVSVELLVQCKFDLILIDNIQSKSNS